MGTHTCDIYLNIHTNNKLKMKKIKVNLKKNQEKLLEIFVTLDRERAQILRGSPLPICPSTSLTAPLLYLPVWLGGPLQLVSSLQLLL